MTTKDNRIFVYSEQCVQSGQVVVNPDRYIEEDGDGDETISPDIWCYASDEADARETAASHLETSNHYLRRCARNVLESL